MMNKLLDCLEKIGAIEMTALDIFEPPIQY